MPLLRKDELELSLKEEKELIKNGKLREDSPLDLSKDFQKLCEACRRGNLKSCQEMITQGANLNARDEFDYTPLILASLCGHYEVVQLLLESGALCERDTFQGERCLYNALNNRIRNLLLSYDYSKSTDPLQPFAAHVTGLLTKSHPATWDIQVTAGDQVFCLHKMLLSARSPYCRKKLDRSPSTRSWVLPSSIPPPAFDVAARFLYLGELPNDLGGGSETGYTEEEVLQGLDRVTKQLEIQSLWDDILESGDRRLARQRRTDELARGRDQIEEWFRMNVLKHKISVETSRAGDVKWSRDNGVFADVLLRADFPVHDEDERSEGSREAEKAKAILPNGIPIGPLQNPIATLPLEAQRSVLFPAHRAMLMRSDYFSTMFCSGFREAQDSDFLHIVHIDCTPDVLEIVLTLLYCEKADFGLNIAIEVLFASEMLFIEKLKTKAATLISTLGNGTMSQVPAVGDRESKEEEEPLDIYEVVRAGWLLRIPRLEEFGARFFAYRLEDHIDEEDFADLIRESASRLQKRQETDSIELLDDIRFYLSERFRLRFEDTGLEEVMDETADAHNKATDGNSETNEHSKDHDPGIVESQNAGMLTISKDSLSATEVESTNGAFRTLDGEIAGDEFASDAVNYQILLGKIDTLLDNLKLDA